MEEEIKNLPIDKKLGEMVEKLAEQRGMSVKELNDETYERLFLYFARRGYEEE